MSKQMIVQNEKSIVAGISKAIDKAENSKRNYILDVILVGEKLNDWKAIVPYGEWKNKVKMLKEVVSDTTFGYERATEYMKVASNKDLVLACFDADTSVRQITQHINNVTPEQIAQVEQIKKDQADKAALAEATAALAETARILKAAQEDEVIEGVFEEVKAPVVELEIVERPVEDPFDVLQETIEMLETDNTALQTEIESMVKVFESNDQLTTALAEVKKFQELARVLKESLNGSMNSENAAKRQAKMWKAKYEKLAKEVGRE